MASCQLQSRNLGVDLNCSKPICELYTEEGTLAILDQCPKTHMYYCDLWVLMKQPRCLFVPLEDGIMPELHFLVFLL